MLSGINIPDECSLPIQRKPQRRKSSIAKKIDIKERKDQAALDFLVSGTAPRKVQFEDKVHCQQIKHYKSDQDATWWSTLEIMNHRKREQAVNHEARKSSDLDVEGLFSIKERNVRNSRMLRASEAVFDSQMIHKKEKELEASVGIFRQGLELEIFDGDHEHAMATEYMNVTAPAVKSAVLRATHLQVHVQSLWEDEPTESSSNVADCFRRAAKRHAAPSIPQRKSSNLSRSRSLLLQEAPSMPLRKSSDHTKTKSLSLEEMSSIAKRKTSKQSKTKSLSLEEMAISAKRKTSKRSKSKSLLLEAQSARFQVTLEQGC
jgi:hypothetical protein